MDNTQILKELQIFYNKTKDADFARFLGISPQTFSSWKKRNSFNASKIIEKCPEINPKWILSGEGDMIRKFSSIVNEPKQSYGKPDTNQETKAIIKELNSLLHRAQKYMEVLKETPPSAQTLEESKKTIKLITEIRKDISEYQNYL